MVHPYPESFSVIVVNYGNRVITYIAKKSTPIRSWRGVGPAKSLTLYMHDNGDAFIKVVEDEGQVLFVNMNSVIFYETKEY